MFGEIGGPNGTDQRSTNLAEAGVCMEKLEVTRNAKTDQFSIVLSMGNDTIRCMVTVEAGHAHSDPEKHRAALSKAKVLARALDSAIEDT
jgi:hypothetical protein